MKVDVDKIISLMRKYTTVESVDNELGEQDSAGGGGGSTSGAGAAKPKYPQVTKWETGLTRGPANQIGLTKWREIVQVKRGKANTLL